MSEKPPKLSKAPPPKRTISGSHPSVRAYREKMDSLEEGALTELQNLNERLDRLKKKSDKPPPDPRRDGDEEVPVDIVELEDSAEKERTP